MNASAVLPQFAPPWSTRAPARVMQALAQADDARLVALATQGNRDAYGELVRRHQTLAFNTAWRLVGDKQDALDVTQDAFVRAYDALASYDPSRPFAPWLYAIVTNVALNFTRARRPVENLELANPESMELAPDPADRALAVDEQQRVRQALLQLAPLPRAVIELRHFQDLSYEEIAATLNLSVSDVKSYLFRGRKKLQELLGASR